MKPKSPPPETTSGQQPASAATSASRRFPRRHVALFAIAVVAVAAVALGFWARIVRDEGGQSSSKSSSATPTTRDQTRDPVFLRAAYRGLLEKLNSAVAANGAEQQAGAQANDLVRGKNAYAADANAFSEYLDGLSRLRFPASMEADVRALISAANDARAAALATSGAANVDEINAAINHYMDADSAFATASMVVQRDIDGLPAP